MAVEILNLQGDVTEITLREKEGQTLYAAARAKLAEANRQRALEHQTNLEREGKTIGYYRRHRPAA
jgi:hypothetical protein